MPNNNNLIPKENIAKVEEVREIENEIPTYEEFFNSYREGQNLTNKTSKLSAAARAKVIKKYGGNYQSSRMDSEDIAIMQMYGPGFWDDIKGVVKPVASVALVAASMFPPTAAVAAPIAYTVIGVGAAATGIGHAADSEGWKEVGKDLLEIGSGARDGQGVAESPQGIKQGSLNEYACSRK